MSNYRDPTHLTAADFDLNADPSITGAKIAQFIRTKAYGVDVRESIARGIEKSSEVAQNAVNVANDTAIRQDNVDQSQKDFEDRYNDQIAGNTNIDETIDLRRDSANNDFKTAKLRVDNIEKSFVYNTQVSMSSETNDIKTALTEFKSTLNSNVTKILLLQDLHFTKRTDMTDGYQIAGPLALEHVGLMEQLTDSVDGVVVNGDNVHGIENKDITIKRNEQVLNNVKAVFGTLPVQITIGNHDDNSVFLKSQVLSLVELESIYGGKTYSYQDYTESKLRVILLSGFENPETGGSMNYYRDSYSIFAQEQLNWLANDALKVPAGYQVLIFNHSPFLGFFNNKPYSYMTNVNHDVLMSILMAFQNGLKTTVNGTNVDYPVSIDVDFSAQGAGTIIACIFGHEHRDVADIQMLNNVRGIQRGANIAVGAGRTIGTVSEHLVDVVEVDTMNKHIKINRFGAGNSLEFDY